MSQNPVTPGEGNTLVSIYSLPLVIGWGPGDSYTSALAMCSLTKWALVARGTLTQRCQSWQLKIRPVPHPFGHRREAHDPNQTNHNTFSEWLGQKWVCDLGWANQSSSLNFSIWNLWCQGTRRHEVKGVLIYHKDESIFHCEEIKDNGWEAEERGKPLSKYASMLWNYCHLQSSFWLVWLLAGVDQKGGWPWGSKDCIRYKRQYPWVF